MKTCRFCNHEQEKGDRCEACGSPFSADKLDFSGETIPDPTRSVTSEPDTSIWGMAVSQPEAPITETPVSEMASGEAEMPVAGEGVPSEPVSDAAEKQPAPVVEPKQPAPETSVSEMTQKPVPPKIMYSAAARSETVYLKKKGSYIPSHGMTIIPPAQNSAPQVVPVVTPPKMDDESFKKYSGIYNHTLITMIISIVGMVCLCGSSLISVILSSIAFSKMSAVKSGTTTKDPDRVAASAKAMTLVADFLLIVGLIFVIVLGVQIISES